MVLSLEFMATCFLCFFLINFIMYLPSLFFHSMHCSSCSALSGVSPNWKKKIAWIFKWRNLGMILSYRGNIFPKLFWSVKLILSHHEQMWMLSAWIISFPNLTLSNQYSQSMNFMALNLRMSLVYSINFCLALLSFGNTSRFKTWA